MVKGSTTIQSFCNLFYSVDEARHWVDCLRPSGGCNAMQAIQELLKWKDFDCIILILGNWLVIKFYVAYYLLDIVFMLLLIRDYSCSTVSLF